MSHPVGLHLLYVSFDPGNMLSLFLCRLLFFLLTSPPHQCRLDFLMWDSVVKPTQCLWLPFVLTGYSGGACLKGHMRIEHL